MKAAQATPCLSCKQLAAGLELLAKKLNLMQAPPPTYLTPVSQALREQEQEILGLQAHLGSCERLRALDRAMVLKQRKELTALRLKHGEPT